MPEPIAPEPDLTRPSDEELRQHLLELGKQAEDTLASEPEESHRPPGFSLLPKDWKAYVTDLEAMCAEHDAEFNDALSGGSRSKMEEMMAQMSEKDKHIVTLTDAIEDHQKTLTAMEEQAKADAEAELRKIIGEELWNADPMAPEKLHNLMEGGMTSEEALLHLRKKAGLEKATRQTPKSAMDIPSSGSAPSVDNYLKKLRGEA